MIEVGDLVRLKPKYRGRSWAEGIREEAGVFLVLELAMRGAFHKVASLEGEKRLKRRTMALCMQGNEKIWLYNTELEKL